MATYQLTLPGQIVKKHNELVRSKVNIISVHGSRVLASLVSCVRSDDIEFKDIYSVPAKELLPSGGGGSYAQIKDVCKELISSAVEIEMQDPDDETVLVLFSFFSSIKYKKGIIEARFNQEMKGFLLELKKHFTQYNLMDYLILSSIYSQRLFELLKSWQSMPEIIIELKELHKILLVPDSCKSNFGEFRRNILEKSYKEIFTKIGFHFEWEAVKKGRAVVAVRFTFAKKRVLPVAKAKSMDIQGKQSKADTKLCLLANKCQKLKAGICDAPTQEKEICLMCKKITMCKNINW